MKLPGPSVITSAVSVSLKVVPCIRHTVERGSLYSNSFQLYESDCGYGKNNTQSFMVTNSEFLLTFAIVNNSVAIDHGVVSHLYHFLFNLS